jgi:hypothetical protein
MMFIIDGKSDSVGYIVYDTEKTDRQEIRLYLSSIARLLSEMCITVIFERRKK